MVALLNTTIIGIFLLIIAIVQAKPLLDTSDNNDEHKTPIKFQQLYELYKIMRTDPRLISMSNIDIVLFLYKNFALRNGPDVDFIQAKYGNPRLYRYQKAVQIQ